MALPYVPIYNCSLQLLSTAALPSSYNALVNTYAYSRVASWAFLGGRLEVDPAHKLVPKTFGFGAEPFSHSSFCAQ